MRANAHIRIEQLDQQTMTSDAAQDLLRAAMDQASLSTHCYHKILRVSQTIANLTGDNKISCAALSEALAYRAIPLLA